MELFFATEIHDDYLTLSEEESKHAVKVFRKEKGGILHITDGKGNLFKTFITDSNPRKCIVKIEDKISSPNTLPYHLHIAIAPTKNHDRIEWFVEKATEIGINEISILICKHSERKNIMKERLQRIMVSGMKQSQRLYLPVLNPEISFESFIQKEFNGEKFIASCQGDAKKSLKSIYHKGSNVLLLIGPEGDFSPDEIQAALQQGYATVSLGNSRYRTETAAMIACHSIAFMNEE